MPPLRLAIPAVAAAWGVLFEVPRLAGLVDHDPAANDFRLFYVAAEAGAQHGWARMYDPHWLQQLSLAFAGSPPITAAYTYDFPPLLAWLVIPLTLMPLAAAFYVWAGVGVAALAGASRLAFPGDPFRWLTALLVTLALWPTVFAVERGQPDLLVYALAIASWWLADRRRDRWAGVVLGVGWAIKPQLLLLLPLVFLFSRHARATAWWLATTAALGAVFVLVLGRDGVAAYLSALEWAASDPAFAAPPIFAPLGPSLSLLVGQGIVGAIALGGAWRHRSSLRVAFAIGLVGTLASAVHLHEYDYVGLVVAAWLLFSAGGVSALELGWLGVGVVCGQLTAVGIRWPIVLWTPVWLVLLTLKPPVADRKRPAPEPEQWPHGAGAPEERPATG